MVTGAASGFGAEIARQYVAQGAKVVVADLNEAGAVAGASSLGDGAMAFTCDVTKEALIQALVAKTLERFGKIDIAVSQPCYRRIATRVSKKKQ